MSLDPLQSKPHADEPVTAEDRQRLHDGEAWFARRGAKGISMEEVLADMGLKPEDFPHRSQAYK